MAKFLQDGFEYLPSSTPSNALLGIGGWSQGSAFTRQTGRFGGDTYAVRMTGSGNSPDTVTSNLVRFFPNAGSYSRIIGGVSVQVAGTPSSPVNTTRAISFINGSTGNMNTSTRIQVGIGFDVTNFEVVVYRGTTEIGRSSPGVFALDTWYRLEWDITFNDTTGAVTLKLNGGDIVTLTSVDTNNALSNLCNGIRLNHFNQSNGNIFLWYDDLVLMDTTGSRLNGFIGDCRIDRLAPTADVSTALTGTGTGAGNWDRLDDVGIDATNYVEGTSGQTDVYELADLGSTTEILGVTVRARAFRTGTDLFKLRFGLQAGAGAAVNDTDQISMNAAAEPVRADMDINPDTGVPWTPAEIDALRLHLKVEL
jgi:hypothetical protein